MKKFLFSALAVALALVSCTKEGKVQPDGDGLVTFRAELPGVIATKSYSDGKSAVRLNYYVYDEDNSGVNIEALNGTSEFSDLTAEVSLRLVAGKNYSIVFWAQSPDASCYSYDVEGREVAVTYGEAAQSEDRDAFYVYEPSFKVTGPISKTVTLKRPFAQINVGTSDYADALAAGLTVTESSMKVSGIANKINLADGSISGNESVEFTTASIPAESEGFPVSGYRYLGMNYVLVGAERSTVDIEFDCGAPEVMTFAQVPVQRNYRTNIYGALLTKPAEFTVVIDNKYGEGDGYHFDLDQDSGEVVANVVTFEEAEVAMKSGLTNIVIAEAPAEAATLNIPKIFAAGNEETLSITLPATDKDIILSYGDQTESAPKNIEVKASTTGKLSIIAPESTVSISGSFGDLEVETADDTLVVGEDAEVESLEVKKGNVVIYGTVKSTLFWKDAGVVKLWQVSDAENLAYAAQVEEGRLEKIVLVDNADITLVKDIDLGNHPVWFAGKVDLGGNTVNLGCENWINVEKDLTLANGTIDNTEAGEPQAGHQKSLIHITGGDFILDGVTLINDMTYHWHGNTFNSSAVSYWNDAKITIRNSRIYSGEFTLCGMGRGGLNTSDVYLVDSYFESNSSNTDNGSHWAYAMRVFGKKIVLENCEVKGIQGGVSIEECDDAEIKSGKYYTVNTPGKSDAFYAVYLTAGAKLKISGGEFSGARLHTGLEIGGTSAVVSGDNDRDYEVGTYTIIGGKFSGKAYNHVTNKLYAPADGYEWKAIEGGDVLGEKPLVWEVVPAAE